MKYILLIVVLLNIFILYLNIRKSKDLKNEKKLIKAQKSKEQAITKYYKLAKENNEKISKIKHNLRNQIQIAYAMFEENKTKGMQMLENIENEIENIKPIKYCKNDILNIILSIKIEEAQKYGINIELKIDSSIFLNIDEIDICDIFTNILDNSIETTKNEKNKNITLYLYKKMNYIIIKCENFYSNIKIDKYGNLKTNKKDKSHHGYGIKTIEEITNKYKGELNIKTDNNIFKIIILLPENVLKDTKNKKYKNYIKK